MKFTLTPRQFAGTLLPLLLIVVVSAASATTVAQVGGGAGGGGGALPWDGALATLASALTGNTAKIISVIAIFVAGIALIFGEDLGHFAKRLLMIVIAVAFLVGAGSFVNTIVTGAHI